MYNVLSLGKRQRPMKNLINCAKKENCEENAEKPHSENKHEKLLNTIGKMINVVKKVIKINFYLPYEDFRNKTFYFIT